MPSALKAGNANRRRMVQLHSRNAEDLCGRQASQPDHGHEPGSEKSCADTIDIHDGVDAGRSECRTGRGGAEQHEGCLRAGGEVHSCEPERNPYGASIRPGWNAVGTPNQAGQGGRSPVTVFTAVNWDARPERRRQRRHPTPRIHDCMVAKNAFKRANGAARAEEAKS